MGRLALIGAKLKRGGAAANVAIALVIQVLAVFAAMLLESWGFSDATDVLVFVLGVLLTAMFTTETQWCLIASILSVLCFNFFLTDPRFSFHIQAADVWGTMAVMFVVALVASYLVTNMRENERKSAEALAKAQNEQMRADLLRSVSHDLRTPLTAIMGNAEMLLDKDVELSDEGRRRLTSDVRDDATWLSGVVENLLAITRLEDDRVALNHDVELVDDLVEEALQHVSAEVAQHQLDLSVDPETLLVRVDPQIMVQAVVNLVNNAVEHTPAGSHIMVSTSRDGDWALVSVADDGPGVADADKTRVFEPFFTSGRVVADGKRGIGLGLSLCRTIAEAHGGTLQVTDAEPHGAVFTLRLPLVELQKEDARDE